MKAPTYQEVLDRIRIGAKVVMTNPEAVSWVDMGTHGIITGLSNNSLNDPKETRVQIRWHIDGEGSYDHYPLYDVPFRMTVD